MITDDQIRALMREAIEAGDYRQVSMCRLALLGDEDLDPRLTINRARRECERAIEDARAQENE